MTDPKPTRLESIKAEIAELERDREERFEDSLRWYTCVSAQDVRWLIRRVERLEGALKFYAKEQHYQDERPDEHGFCILQNTSGEARFVELGLTARQALSEEDEEVSE